MTLTPHFSLEEFERSATAERAHLDNHAPSFAISNLQRLCQQVLEPLRVWYGAPILISSGYRSSALNRRVGGAPRSQHREGEAADLRLASLPPERYGRELRRLFDYIRFHLPFDQLIWEYSGQTYWIHVSLRAKGNRRQVFAMGKK